MVLPHIPAALMIADGGNTGMGAIIGFMPYCLLCAKSREGVSVDGVAMVTPFCIETEIGTIDGIMFLRGSVARLISQANKSLAALAVLKYMFRRDS